MYYWCVPFRPPRWFMQLSIPNILRFCLNAYMPQIVQFMLLLCTWRSPLDSPLWRPLLDPGVSVQFSVCTGQENPSSYILQFQIESSIIWTLKQVKDLRSKTKQKQESKLRFVWKPLKTPFFILTWPEISL